MQINIRINGLALLLVIAVLAVAGWLAWRIGLPGFASRVETTRIVAQEAPVVMRTAGGLLEVATVRAHERFTRSDTREFWGIPLGTTVSQIEVVAVYRYHIPLAEAWPLDVRGRTCTVRAAAVAPSLPVALDSTTLRKHTRSGWALFNKSENLAALERSLTAELQTRAKSPQYLRLATDAGRLTVAEFVTNWLVKEQAWRRDPHHEVVVLFPGESRPAPAAPPPAALQQS